MSTATSNLGLSGYTSGAPKNSTTGFWNGFWARLVEARTRDAERVIVLELQKKSDESLKFYGYSPAEIEKIRNGEFFLPDTSDKNS
ncbi:MAG: hypothetical protein ACR2OW_00705 [Methyloligellaceae bacterium]